MTLTMTASSMPPLTAGLSSTLERFDNTVNEHVWLA